MAALATRRVKYREVLHQKSCCVGCTNAASARMRKSGQMSGMTFFRVSLIQTALNHTCRGHKQDAAKKLGCGRNTLTRKLKELGL